MNEHDVVFTILTDSMELYTSRLGEQRQEFGEYSESQAAADYARYLRGVTSDNMLELSYADRKRVHNLKYYTWVEQQGKTYPEIQAQWYDPDYWTEFQSQAAEIDELIKEFNSDVGILK
jgi:cysteine synthase A